MINKSYKQNTYSMGNTNFPKFAGIERVEVLPVGGDGHKILLKKVARSIIKRI